MDKKANIGVYAGSFDPVHLGHIAIVNHLLSKGILEKVIIIPTGDYWDKKNITDMKERINMLRIFENDRIIIDSTIGKYQYTYEIIKSLNTKYKNVNLHFIIGADNLEKFHLWKNVELILQNKVIVINRNGIDAMKYINKFKEKDSFIVIEDFKEINISSSEIKERIKNKKDTSDLIDVRVADYIKKNNLYGGE